MAGPLKELKKALNELAAQLAIEPLHKAKPALWREFNELLKGYRDYFIHPNPEGFHSHVQATANLQWGFASRVASDIIRYYFEASGNEVPNWVSHPGLRCRGFDLVGIEPRHGVRAPDRSTGTGSAAAHAERLGLMELPVELSKIEIAKLQLDRAIALMLDDKDYVSAITLAGASEEITGSLLRKSGHKSIYDELKNGFEKLVQLRHGRALDSKSFNRLANGIRNGLKHLDNGAPLQFDLEDAAADIVDRAVSNFWKLTSQETQNMERFKEYHMNRGKND